MELDLYAAIALQALIIGVLLKPVLEEGPSENRSQRWLRALELFGILCLGVSLFTFTMATYISDFYDVGLILSWVLLPLGIIVMIISYCWSLRAG
ncbi:hypothetical protein IBZ12_21360 [Serratia ureilytica]|uniref:hypothetical protein n=1 Tax=Serratia ureilytica TaxID=300181 RepID=UPI0039B53405